MTSIQRPRRPSSRKPPGFDNRKRVLDEFHLEVSPRVKHIVQQRIALKRFEEDALALSQSNSRSSVRKSILPKSLRNITLDNKTENIPSRSRKGGSFRSWDCAKWLKNHGKLSGREVIHMKRTIRTWFVELVGNTEGSLTVDHLNRALVGLGLAEDLTDVVELFRKLKHNVVGAAQENESLSFSCDEFVAVVLRPTLLAQPSSTERPGENPLRKLFEIIYKSHVETTQDEDCEPQLSMTHAALVCQRRRLINTAINGHPSTRNQLMKVLEGIIDDTNDSSQVTDINQTLSFCKNGYSASKEFVLASPTNEGSFSHPIKKQGTIQIKPFRRSRQARTSLIAFQSETV